MSVVNNYFCLSQRFQSVAFVPTCGPQSGQKRPFLTSLISGTCKCMEITIPNITSIFLFQDTIVALQALSEYARLAFKGGVSMTLDIKVRRPTGIPDAQILITEDNRLLLQEVQVPVPGAIVLRGRGNGCALVQVYILANLIAYTD